MSYDRYILSNIWDHERYIEALFSRIFFPHLKQTQEPSFNGTLKCNARELAKVTRRACRCPAKACFEVKGQETPPGVSKPSYHERKSSICFITVIKWN